MIPQNSYYMIMTRHLFLGQRQRLLQIVVVHQDCWWWCSSIVKTLRNNDCKKYELSITTHWINARRRSPKSIDS